MSLICTLASTILSVKFVKLKPITVVVDVPLLVKAVVGVVPNDAINLLLKSVVIYYPIANADCTPMSCAVAEVTPTLVPATLNHPNPLYTST